ncbi:MAG: hypothetical protein WKF73_14725 [Nocardioidaceae bacterium]
MFRPCGEYDAVLVGGAAAGVGLLDRARAHGVRVVTTYGMTETSGGCVYDGVPLDGVGVALSREGEIRISGPVLFDGYAADPDLTSQVLRNNWFHTSDLGRLDLDGRLEVIGRSDDMVKSGGVERDPATGGTPDSRAAGRNGSASLSGHRMRSGVSEWSPRWCRAAGSCRARLSRPCVSWVSERHPRSWAPRQLVVLEGSAHAGGLASSTVSASSSWRTPPPGTLVDSARGGGAQMRRVRAADEDAFSRRGPPRGRGPPWVRWSR